MKSFQGSANSLVNMFTTLAQNTSTNNTTLATVLINDQSRQLYLKFFDNERTYTMTTQGSTTATIVAGLVAGSTSATLTAAWPTTNISCQQLVVFPDGEQRNVNFTQGSTQITWQSGLVPSGSTAATTLAAGTQATLVGVQSYPLPANVSKVKNATITVGQLVYTPAPVQSIQEWTKLNALPYASSIPAYFYIYNNQLLFWPIPSTTGEVITINCQINVADMTYSDVTSGNIALNGMVVGSNIVTGTGTTWSSSFPLNVDLTYANLFITANPPNGDGLPYQIQSFQSDTSLTLIKPVVNAPHITATTTYTIGQYPLLGSDFHDAIVYGALRVYFMSIVKDPDRYQLYERLFNEKLQLMEFYLSTKQVNVDLSVTPQQTNPNLYINPSTSS